MLVGMYIYACIRYRYSKLCNVCRSLCYDVYDINSVAV